MPCRVIQAHIKGFRTSHSQWNAMGQSTEMSPEWGWLHETRHVFNIVSQPNGGIGVCLYIAETNFVFPQMLYKSEYHQR